MQIIIPMSGFGKRFKDYGYKSPKFLIDVNGKPIISYVIDMFPKEKDFLFICNKDHLRNKKFHVKKVIKQFCPSGKVVGIKPHNLGPVHTILQAEKEIKKGIPTIVNYCDFTCYWNWRDFKKFVLSKDCEGAIPAYKGFHPHSLGKNYYSYLKENRKKVVDIREKSCFTKNRTEEYASSGTYYFSNSNEMIEAFKKQIESKLITNGEYYVSLSYKKMISEKKKILVYPIKYFMQWGTPEDLDEYNYWSKTFTNLVKKRKRSKLKGSLIIPMAGIGKRFLDEKYKKPKPLIKVSGKEMVIQATRALPEFERSLFLVRKNMKDSQKIKKKVNKIFKNSDVVLIPGYTGGQLCTIDVGIDYLLKKNSRLINSPVTITSCDSKLIYDHKKLINLLNDKDTDIIVLGLKNYPEAIKKPNMFGWLYISDGRVKKVSVKKKINGKENSIILGTFIFKKMKYFIESSTLLKNRKGKVNQEYYVDSCLNDAIEMGLKCRMLEVDSFVSWGTPNELKTFEYWQSCFNKWKSHEYKISNDSDFKN
jgi:NDP-sugar pyrophosphorylase family protein